jgi:outer membrane protein OmpA-like peptidoglycan-associated protein/tetratricopeptide (TPR) repeat protein
MIIKNIFLSLLLMVLAFGAAYGQSAKLKRANQAYESLNYMEAIKLYTDILDKNDASEAKIKLADSYRKVGNTAEAEYWYGQVVRLPEAEPIHKLYYGMMLQTNGKCELAQEWYDKYIADVPGDLRGQYLSKACNYEEELMTKNGGIYEIKHMPFNTSKDDFSPMFYKDGLVYTTEYEKIGPVAREHTWTGDPFTDLFYVRANPIDEETHEYEYGRSETFSNRINSKYHDATATFADGEKYIYFTRNNVFRGKTGKDDEGTVRLKIFKAENIGGNAWTNMEGMPFNSDEYSVAHPTLSRDAKKLYFSSDMPGGFGGMDLYVSEEESGRWGPPVNLGPSINTEGNEVFPYYSPDAKLYFASDGHTGLGGLDIYFMEDKNGQWGQIINVGYPLNSRSDDFGIVFKDEKGIFGYFASDREGGTGDDDIYSFVKTAATVELFVYDEKTRKGIEGATVKNDCTGNTLTTDATGHATLEMKLEQCCTFEANKEPYDNNSKEGCTKNLKAGDKVFVEIPLKKQEETPAIAAKPAGNFSLEGLVIDKLSNLPVEGAEVRLINDCGKEEPVSVFTDATGRYHFDLAEDCCYTAKATKTGYLSGKVENKCTKNKAPGTLTGDIYLQKYIRTEEDVVSTPTNPYTTEGTINTGTEYRSGGDVEISRSDHGQIGAIPFLLNIYYDFDQSYIRADAEPELEKLYQILVDNPELVVEIGSHTDSRGSSTYNERLSQRRAEAVVRWLRTKGVSKARLRPHGYGESMNVNQCADNVPCSEEEHQWNRRTEFKVVGVYNGEGQYKELDSQRPANVNVDPCQGCPF